MKIKLTSISIILLLTTVTSAVSADLLFRPRASLGYSFYKLKLAAVKYDSSYLSGSLGATIATENYYLDFSYTTSLEADYDFPDKGTFDFKRTDINLTVGANLHDDLTVFTGYKTGESSFDIDNDKIVFEATGPFFGITKSVPINDSLISFNAAVAFLNGKLKSSDGFFDEKADTAGFSLGIAYSHFLTNDSGIIYKGAYQQYDFKDFTAKETLLAVEISYYKDF